MPCQQTTQVLRDAWHVLCVLVEAGVEDDDERDEKEAQHQHDDDGADAAESAREGALQWRVNNRVCQLVVQRQVVTKNKKLRRKRDALMQFSCGRNMLSSGE
eukprot:364163-Chlamydomonas_euryale.AAC.16